MTISVDQLYMLGLAVILVFASVNAIHFNNRFEWTKGESFWLWGMACLALSLALFGLTPHAGPLGLAVANLLLFGSYVALAFQLRYWKTGRGNVSWKVFVVALAYMAALEYSRYFLPYFVRSTILHGTMSILLVYLFVASINLYRQSNQQQLLFLAATFGVEALCTMFRTIYPIVTHDNTTTTLYTEQVPMIIARWLWATINITTYITVMLYQLEKTTSKKQNLESLISENDQLLRATTVVSRTNHANLLTGSIMHELRQPLSTILLGSTSLNRAFTQAAPHSPEPAMLAQYAAMIEKEATRSMHIMNKLEEVYAPDRQSYQRVLVPELVERSLALIENRIQNNQVKIEKLYQSSGEVYGNTLQLESVVTNLLSNSVKALAQTNHARIIKISVRDESNRVILAVRDNGPGIPMSVLPNIYSLFVSESEKGVGIGLWLSKLIIENHHGEIDCKNNTGGGATFTVSLPTSK